jgi:hypothetical protein
VGTYFSDGENNSTYNYHILISLCIVHSEDKIWILHVEKSVNKLFCVNKYARLFSIQRWYLIQYKLARQLYTLTAFHQSDCRPATAVLDVVFSFPYKDCNAITINIVSSKCNYYTFFLWINTRSIFNLHLWYQFQSLIKGYALQSKAWLDRSMSTWESWTSAY